MHELIKLISANKKTIIQYKQFLYQAKNFEKEIIERADQYNIWRNLEKIYLNLVAFDDKNPAHWLDISHTLREMLTQHENDKR